MWECRALWIIYFLWYLSHNLFLFIPSIWSTCVTADRHWKWPKRAWKRDWQREKEKGREKRKGGSWAVFNALMYSVWGFTSVLDSEALMATWAWMLSYYRYYMKLLVLCEGELWKALDQYLQWMWVEIRGSAGLTGLIYSSGVPPSFSSNHSLQRPTPYISI